MFDELMLRIGDRFRRVEPRRRARAFILGLVAGLPRKNCWTIAEHAGDDNPGGMQHLLSRASWDADGARDDLRAYVIEHLGNRQAALVVDETGDVKKGTATVGVQRQYTGTAGRVENAQVAVYLTDAAPAGHALIDRVLYLPRSWVRDEERCAAAGIPEGTMFATKPALAARMIGRALDAGTPAAWVTGDEVYGADPGLRASLKRAADRIRAGRGQEPHGGRQCRAGPGGRPGREAAAPVLAAAVGRGRRQGPPLVRLGLDCHRARPPWMPLAADPPQPAHPRTGLLPLLVAAPGAVGRAGARGRNPLERGRELCRWQGPGRPGRASGPALDLAVPVGHPRHARPGIPHRGRRGRARPAPAGRDDPTDAQRDSPLGRRPNPPARSRGRPPAALVHLAPPPPAHRPDLPLPAPECPRSTTATICHHSADPSSTTLGAGRPVLTRLPRRRSAAGAGPRGRCAAHTPRSCEP